MRLRFILFAPAFALGLAAPVLADQEKREQAYIMGASWAKGGVSVACMVEVTHPKEKHRLKEPLVREAAAYKAQMLAGAHRIQLRLLDQMLPLYDKREAQQRELLENGIITRAEYDAVISEDAAEVKEDIANVAGVITDYPACDFYRLHQKSPTVQRAKAQLAAR